MTNYPCETKCGRCNGFTKFFLNSIQGHGGFRCKKCKIYILLPRMINTAYPTNLEIDGKDYVYLKWYRKLYHTSQDQYGSIFTLKLNSMEEYHL